MNTERLLPEVNSIYVHFVAKKCTFYLTAYTETRTTLNDLYGKERPWMKWKADKRYVGRKAEWDYIHRSEIRNYINAYEYACGLYQAGALDKRLFGDVFRDDIIFIYENDFGAGVGISVKDSSKGTYEHLRKTYSEFKALK